MTVEKGVGRKDTSQQNTTTKLVRIAKTYPALPPPFFFKCHEYFKNAKALAKLNISQKKW